MSRVKTNEFCDVAFNFQTLGIWSFSQPNGLTVPDASMHPVKSTSDVFDLMKIGETNRAIGTTALNERSSRSHRFFQNISLSLFSP